MTFKGDRLASIRKRISIIREILEDPAYLTNVSADGISESVDRDQLNRELKELEREEARLSGSYSRFHSVDTTRA